MTANDPDSGDAIIKLNLGKNLNLDQRTIVILGVPAGLLLPDSVATIHDYSNEATLPIACGVIVKMANESTVER